MTLPLAGRLLVGYFRLVYATARITELTPDISGRFEARRPFIMAIWHGESLMVPFARPVRWPVHAMTSRSKDGGIVAQILALYYRGGETTLNGVNK